MRCQRVAVLGGGPGGLYAARLLKLAEPSCEVTVYEQGDPDSTFGFGVGLAARTQRNLHAADPDTLRDILAGGRPHDMTMRVDGRIARVHSDNLLGVARTDLLSVLQRHAEKVGVELEFGRRRSAGELDADVIIAADGVSSATRAAGGFGSKVEEGRGLFMWCGVDVAIENALFAPVETEFGTFVTHAYPYSAQRSTFLVETDEATWRRAGFDVTTERTPVEESDTASLAYLSDVFSEHLLGRPLIGNRTRWSRFRTVRCGRWSDGNTVLLGDAAHTAHFSIGSGTKLAMEDAIALVQALTERADAGSAFHRYEQMRRPAVERLQDLARRSQLWWESFPQRMHQPVEQLMVAYMTRAGNVPLERFAASSPDVVIAALGQYAGTPARHVDPERVPSWIVEQPLHHDDVRYPSRLLGPEQRRTLDLVPLEQSPADPWSPAADAVVDRARRARGRGFWLSAADRDALLSVLDLGERLRWETGGLVVVSAPESLLPDLAAGLLSGRADLIAFDEEVPV